MSRGLGDVYKRQIQHVRGDLRGIDFRHSESVLEAVSYTHLTLPTILRV
ncbi:hypothetical protein JMUB7535_26950 [Staphylococcus aureus]